MTFKTIMCMVLFLLLSACSGDGFTMTTNQGSGIIDNEDLTPGLKGIDADANGIRDDVDRLIAKKYSATPEMKRAAEQTSRALQLALESTNKDQARFVGNELMRASDCAYQAISDDNFRSQLSKEMEALTANTKERFSAYWKGEKMAGGMVFSPPAKLICD